MAGAGVVGPGFPKGRGENLLFGKNVVSKLHENEENFTKGGGGGVPFPFRDQAPNQRGYRQTNFDIYFKQQSLHRPHIPQLKQHAQVVQHAQHNQSQTEGEA